MRRFTGSGSSPGEGNVGSEKLISRASAATAQIGFDHQLGTATKADAIDLQVFHYALDVIAGLGERDAFDPVDRIDARVTRVAIASDPFLYPAASGIVGRKCHDVGAAIIFQHSGEFGRAELDVIDAVAHQALFVERAA